MIIASRDYIRTSILNDAFELPSLEEIQEMDKHLAVF